MVKLFNIENSCFAGSVMEEENDEEGGKREENKYAKDEMEDRRWKSEDDRGGDGSDGKEGGEGWEGDVEGDVGGITTVQGSEHQGGDEGKEEEKRSMVSKSLEPQERWEEEDKDRWEKKEGSNDNQRNRGRYGRD